MRPARPPRRPSGQRRSGTRPASHAYTRLSRRGSAQVHFDVYRAGDICLTAEGMARFLALQPPVVVEKKAITLDPKVLDRYVGTYVIGAGASLIVTREGAGLVVRQSGSDVPTALLAETPTTFFVKGQELTVTFVAGPTGAIEK